MRRASISSVTVVRPDPRTVRGAIVVPVLATFIVVLWSLLTGGPLLLPFVIGAVVTLAVGVWVLVYLLRARLEIDAAGIRRTSITGFVSTIAAHRIAHIVMVDLASPILEERPHTAVLDANGEPLLYLNGAIWRPDDLKPALASFSDRLSVFSERATVREVTDRYPLALPFAVRKPGVTALGVLGALLAILIVAVSLVGTF